MNSKRIAAVLAIGLPLGVTACGGSDDASDPLLASLSPASRNVFGAVISRSDPYRVEMGVSMLVSFAGEEREVGSDGPVSTIDVDSEGQMHQHTDVAAFQGEVEQAIPADATVDLWIDGDDAVFDVGEGYAELAERSQRDGDTGDVSDAMGELFQPGMFTVDFSKVDDDGASMFNEAGGSNDPSAMFAAMAERYPDSDGDEDDASRTYTIPFAELSANPDNADTLARSITGGAEGLDQAVIDQFLTDVLNTEAVTTVTTDDQGRVASAVIVINLSEPMKNFMNAAVAEELDGSEVDELQQALMAQLTDIEMEQTIEMTLDYDDSIEVDMPGDVSDDRTAQMEAFVNAVQSDVDSDGAQADADNSADNSAAE